MPKSFRYGARLMAGSKTGSRRLSFSPSTTGCAGTSSLSYLVSTTAAGSKRQARKPLHRLSLTTDIMDVVVLRNRISWTFIRSPPEHHRKVQRRANSPSQDDPPSSHAHPPIRKTPQPPVVQI